MRLYYNDGVYPVTWKTGMRKDRWYSMEPAKIKVTMPSTIYDIISKDINTVNSDPNRESCYRFRFDISKFESDNVKWGISDHKSGLWRVSTFVYSCSVSSRFKNGDVIAIFDLAVDNAELLDKSVFRDRILDELV